MHLSKEIFNRLSIKLILVITCVLLLILSIYTLLIVRAQEKMLTRSLVENVYSVSDVIKKSARYSMLLNRREDVLQIISTIGSEKGMHVIRVYDKVGNVQYSSKNFEIGTKIDMTSEACNKCHSKGRALPDIKDEERIRYFDMNGERVLGLINPIFNEPDCSSADCHYHPPEKKILGVLDIIISTERIDAITESNIKNTITGSIIITILIALSSAFAITSVVNSPLRKIKKGILEVGKGNLSYEINLHTHDELGELAAQFNQMSRKLDGAYSEIKGWNETLNQKVLEKNEELKNIYEQIIHVEKLASLGKLSATVAHELNNPLEGILTYSKLINKILAKQNQENQFDQLIKYLTLISDESARCGRIVKDLLLFSHTNLDKFSSHDLRKIIEKALLLVNHHLEIHKIEVQRNFLNDQMQIVCDDQKIEQALLSIIMNAVDAMPDGGNLTITTDKDIQHAIVHIKDEGHGIAPKDLPNIFDPFFSTKSEQKGTGLGLSVSYGIIMQHKGEVKVEETSNAGTTFKIILPLEMRGS